RTTPGTQSPESASARHLRERQRVLYSQGVRPVAPGPPSSVVFGPRPRAGPRWRSVLMRTRWLPWLPLLAVLALVAAPAPAPAQAKPEAPTLVLRVRSLDALFTSGQLLLEAVGRGHVLKQIDDLIKSKVGPKGLTG